jgi:hypothetical protein
VKDGWRDERRAHALMAEVIAEGEESDRRRAELEAARERAGLTFGAFAEAWLRHAEHVRRLKPSTMRDLRSVLARPGTTNRRGAGVRKARLVTKLGDVPASSITVHDVEAYLHARRQDGPKPLEVFSVEQVEHLARTAAAGAWRATPAWARTADTPAQLRAEDEQLGELRRRGGHGAQSAECGFTHWRRGPRTRFSSGDPIENALHAVLLARPAPTAKGPCCIRSIGRAAGPGPEPGPPWPEPA